MKTVKLFLALFFLITITNVIAGDGVNGFNLKSTNNNKISLSAPSNISNMVLDATKKEIPGSIFAPKRGKPIKGHGN